MPAVCGFDDCSIAVNSATAVPYHRRDSPRCSTSLIIIYTRRSHLVLLNVLVTRLIRLLNDEFSIIDYDLSGNQGIMLIFIFRVWVFKFSGQF